MVLISCKTINTKKDKYMNSLFRIKKYIFLCSFKREKKAKDKLSINKKSEKSLLLNCNLIAFLKRYFLYFKKISN